MWLSCLYFLKMFCLSTKLDPLGLKRSLCALEHLFLFKAPELDSQHATAHNHLWRQFQGIQRPLLTSMGTHLTHTFVRVVTRSFSAENSLTV